MADGRTLIQPLLQKLRSDFANARAALADCKNSEFYKTTSDGSKLKAFVTTYIDSAISATGIPDIVKALRAKDQSIVEAELVNGRIAVTSIVCRPGPVGQ